MTKVRASVRRRINDPKFRAAFAKFLRQQRAVARDKRAPKDRRIAAREALDTQRQARLAGAPPNNLVRHWILDGRDVKPATLWEWAVYLEECTHARKVALTTIGQREVSTVFIGIDMGHGMTGRPLLFETMVFDLDTGSSGEDCERYSTLSEAEAGHLLMVQKQKARVK